MTPWTLGKRPVKNRGVRGIGDRAVRESLREADAVGGERVEGGSFNLFVAVAADMVGAQSVDGDEEDVGLGRIAARSRAPIGVEGAGVRSRRQRSQIGPIDFIRGQRITGLCWAAFCGYGIAIN